MKGLRVAGAATLEAANCYLDEEFVPWWNQHLVVIPANSTDAHRSLGKGHELAAILSRVETRQVGTDYTISIDGKLYRIEENVNLHRPAESEHSDRMEARWNLGGSFSWEVSGLCSVRGTTSVEGRCRQAAQARKTQTSSAFSSHACCNRRVVQTPLAADRSGQQNRSHAHSSKTRLEAEEKDRRAKAARRSSRFEYPQTAARRLHQSRSVLKNQNPQNGQLWTRFDWGLGAICFGASPLAAVFGSAPGSATSPQHRIHLKPAPQFHPAKQDISIWHRTGHFYLALTSRRSFLT